MPSTPALDRLRAIKSLAHLVRLSARPNSIGPSNQTTFRRTSALTITAAELGLKDEVCRQNQGNQTTPPARDRNQPWGIFFVEFEKKKLPVVVLRRILRTLVFKKRQSANKADRQAVWQSRTTFCSFPPLAMRPTAP